MEDLFERLFENAGQAETVLMVIVLAVAAIGIWFGRKKLRVVIPIAIAFVFLAAISIPSWLPARTFARRAACINNLKLIEKVKLGWAKENRKETNEIPSEIDLFGSDLKTKPVCPSGGNYTLGKVRDRPKCSLESKGHKLE